MATIKNWFVRSERVKDKHNGIIKYGKYLVDANHPNHTKTSSIIPIFGNMDNFIKRVSSEAIGLDISNSQKREGDQSNHMLNHLCSVYLHQSKSQPRTNGKNNG